MQRVSARRNIVLPLCFGPAGALFIGVAAFAILPETQLRTVFIGPGIVVMSLFAHLIPESAAESLATQRWAPSFFAVAFTLAVAVWACVFAVCILATHRLHRTQGA